MNAEILQYRDPFRPLLEIMKTIYSCYRDLINQKQDQIILLFITASVCVTWFFITQEHGWGGDHQLITSLSFSAGDHLDHIGPNHYRAPNWKLMKVQQARVASVWLSGKYLDLLNPESVEEFNFAIGFYQFFWLVLTFFVLWKGGLLNPKVTLLVFAGLIFTLCPDPMMYSWDMPSMFMWSLCFSLWYNGKYNWMVFVLILGTLFKESVALLAVLFFFIDLPWRRRIGLFGACFVGCIIIRMIIMHYLFGHVGVMNAAAGDKINGLFLFLTTPSNLRVVFVGAGVVFLSFLLPLPKAIKFLSVSMFVLLTVTPIMAGTGFYEPRQFDDILPILSFYVAKFIK